METKCRFKTLTIFVLAVFAAIMTGSAQENDQIIRDLANSHPRAVKVRPRGHLHANGQAHARFGIPGIDSLINFNGHYFADGFDSEGNPNRHWYYNTVGNPPQHGRTTMINAPIIPVSIDLLDFDRKVRIVKGKPLHYDVTPFVEPTLNSPIFRTSTYSSSNVPTQFTDAVQRAEFYNRAKPDWHTLLNPSVKKGRTMSIARGDYSFALNRDGSCCAFILVDIDAFANLLFPPTVSDKTTPIGAAEHAGDISTKDVSIFLFPNTFLYFYGDPNECCIVGFHSYDFKPGDASNGNRERRYVFTFASWISPGIFSSFEDITALSHEISEIYNDPFVASDGIHNVTPWWLAPNGNCQNDLEDGDVIENLPNATFPITMNGMTYHPQNEALLEWFEFKSPSNALGGAYSYPNQNVLTAPSAPQNAGCQ